MEKNQPHKLQKLMIRPIFMIYKYFQTKSRVCIWMYDNTEMKIEGRIIGFDEYMNCVLDDAEEIVEKKNNKTEAPVRQYIGKIMLKGDNITLIQQCA
uniref:Small nuclear ribonucleoprotein E n=1 Tax=Strombidium rassoulzadegani TaxID=1082188 RepID=A0A7S3CK19_9SPIT